MISILIPTRGRPARLLNCLHSIYDTAAQPADVEVLVRISAEDPALEAYRATPQLFAAARIVVASGCISYGKGIEVLQRLARGDILFAAGDDTLFRTAGWDCAVRAAFDAVPDRLLVAYANNGLDREKCEHFFTSRRWIDTVGYMVWTEFRHFCVDQWVEELANRIGRLRFLRAVTVEHMHKKYGKAPNDATYDLVRGATNTSQADNVLYGRRQAERDAAVARLQAALAN